MIQIRKRRKDSMLAFNLKLSRLQQVELEDQLATAEAKGDLSEVKRILAVLSLAGGQFADDIAEILKVSIETIRQALCRFLLGGAKEMQSKSRSGRPPKAMCKNNFSLKEDF